MGRGTYFGWAVGLIAALAPQPAAHALPSDDFNDNSRGTAWSEVEDNATLLSVSEQGQRLEAASSKTSATDLDALYLSDGPAGFALSAAHDFQMRISYDIGATLTSAQTSGGSDWRFALDFGFGTTAGGENSFAAAVAWAPFPIGGAPFRGLGAAYRTNDVQPPPALIDPTAPQAGTLYLSYETAGDVVRVSDAGYGAADADYSLAGIVQGQWNADTLLVAFGARGHGVDIAPGAAWLDDFVVDAGTIVPVPEPATAALPVMALAAARVQRSRRRR